MMLVGDVADRIAILIDDLADTSNTITRAAKLLKNEGASRVYALVTHGILSGDAIERINASALDRVIVTNTVDQSEHLTRCPKLEVLDVGTVFSEVIIYPTSLILISRAVLLTAQPSGHPPCPPWRKYQRPLSIRLGKATVMIYAHNSQI